jgi:hypothetical protein
MKNACEGEEFFLSSFLGSTAQLRPWPPPKNPAEFLGGFSTMKVRKCINLFKSLKYMGG